MAIFSNFFVDINIHIIRCNSGEEIKSIFEHFHVCNYNVKDYDEIFSRSKDFYFKSQACKQGQLTDASNLDVFLNETCSS
jgi:hypothetical protein